MFDIDPAEMAAAKTEMWEALRRRYEHDGRSSADLFGAMSTVVAEMLADMIAAAGKDKAHRRHLIEIIGLFVERHTEIAARHLGKA